MDLGQARASERQTPSGKPGPNGKCLFIVPLPLGIFIEPKPCSIGNYVSAHLIRCLRPFGSARLP